ncbi:MAG: hypothetical protein LBN11_04955 [Tannerella sp.]|nr:hypothetical protein [Tannerella sp.]
MIEETNPNQAGCWVCSIVCPTDETVRYAGHGLLLAHEDNTIPANMQTTNTITTFFIETILK